MDPADEKTILSLVCELREKRRSSPDADHWHKFFKAITTGVPKPQRPSLPLILGGSIASDAAKLQRLQEHLEWAAERGRLTQAIEYLRNIPEKYWAIGSVETWNTAYSPFGDEV